MDVCKTGGRHSFDNDPELLPKRDWKSFYLTLQKALLGGAPSDRFRCGIEIRVKQIVADYRLNGEPEALGTCRDRGTSDDEIRSEEHTSELQSRLHLVCRLLLEKKKKKKKRKYK